MSDRLFGGGMGDPSAPPPRVKEPAEMSTPSIKHALIMGYAEVGSERDRALRAELAKREAES